MSNVILKRRSDSHQRMSDEEVISAIQSQSPMNLARRLLRFRSVTIDNQKDPIEQRRLEFETVNDIIGLVMNDKILVVDVKSGRITNTIAGRVKTITINDLLEVLRTSGLIGVDDNVSSLAFSRSGVHAIID